ncbi:MAG: YtxH domain-containing protein [Anaerolineae bacterium]
MSERNESESSFGAFLAGFIIGGLVGAAVALILAPQSGEETRTQFAERSVDWRDRVNENRQNWSENVNKMTNNASETLGGIDINSIVGRKNSEQDEEDQGADS